MEWDYKTMVMTTIMGLIMSSEQFKGCESNLRLVATAYMTEIEVDFRVRYCNS